MININLTSYQGEHEREITNTESNTLNILRLVAGFRPNGHNLLMAYHYIIDRINNDIVFKPAITLAAYTLKSWDMQTLTTDIHISKSTIISNSSFIFGVRRDLLEHVKFISIVEKMCWISVRLVIVIQIVVLLVTRLL